MPDSKDTFISYAQNREDVLLWRALGTLPHGFYVDIGAQHPVNASVTKAFYDRGWNGINIEPDPAGFADLRDQRPRDINLNLAVSNRPTPQRFWCVDQTGLSTLDATVADAYRNQGLNVREMEIEVRPLSSILLAHASCDIHFLKIDVEGHERAVLESCDFEKFRPWVIVVEATAPRSTLPQHQIWESLLTDRSYSCVHFDGVNRYYLAGEHADLEPHFSHPPCIFDHFRSSREWELERERSAHLASIRRLSVLLEESERDRAARLESIHRLSSLLEQAEKEKAAGIAQIHRLESRLAEIEKR